MTKIDLRFGVLAALLWLPATLASAQWDASTQEGTSTTATTAPTPPPAPSDQMVSATPPPAVQEPEEKKAFQPVGFTWGLSIAVPIFLDVPSDVVRPGAAINFFGGADFGFFVIGGDAGLQWNPIDLNGVNVAGNPPVTLSGRSPLTRIYLSIPEVPLPGARSQGRPSVHLGRVRHELLELPRDPGGLRLLVLQPVLRVSLHARLHR